MHQQLDFQHPLFLSQSITVYWDEFYNFNKVTSNSMAVIYIKEPDTTEWAELISTLEKIKETEDRIQFCTTETSDVIQVFIWPTIPSSLLVLEPFNTFMLDSVQVTKHCIVISFNKNI